MGKYGKVSFGKILREYRREINMTQKILGKNSGIKQGSISLIETCEVEDPHLSTVLRLCNGLDVWLDELLRK